MWDKWQWLNINTVNEAKYHFDSWIMENIRFSPSSAAFARGPSTTRREYYCMTSSLRPEWIHMTRPWKSSGIRWSYINPTLTSRLASKRSTTPTSSWWSSTLSTARFSAWVNDMLAQTGQALWWGEPQAGGDEPHNTSTWVSLSQVPGCESD